MTIALIVSSVLLWLLLVFVAFVLLGSLRAMALMRWRMAQLEATTPSRLGRNGLRPGKKAPVFRLPSVVGPETALADFAGRKVFLVFVQSGCGPCSAVVPDLNQLHREGRYQLLVVNNAERDKAREWVSELVGSPFFGPLEMGVPLRFIDALTHSFSAAVPAGRGRIPH